jgi:acetolactate synthase-1/2/3 large subunit
MTFDRTVPLKPLDPAALKKAEADKKGEQAPKPESAPKPEPTPQAKPAPKSEPAPPKPELSLADDSLPAIDFTPATPPKAEPPKPTPAPAQKAEPPKAAPTPDVSQRIQTTAAPAPKPAPTPDVSQRIQPGAAPAPKPTPAPTPKAEAPKAAPSPDVSQRIEPTLAPAAKVEAAALKADTAAEAWLGLLAARGIEYLFANGGTDFAPVAEAFAKCQKAGTRLPKVVITPHENLGVAMAHGYAMVTGRPQAMMVHVGVGTANALNGLINASRQNVPILFSAGRTPITESGAVTAARNNYIHWAQEHFDQGAMLREFVKWDYELRHAEQVETVLDRALAIAKSEPQGPVYVTLPREILASDFSKNSYSEKPTVVAASAPAADAQALEEAVKLLAAAQHPLLITANGGRTTESAQAIEQLAQAMAVPVVQYRPRHMAISTEHPMHCGWDPHGLLKSADLVLVVDCDVPWIPKEGKPAPGTKVVHIGPDPLFARYPLRGFRVDLAVTGAVGPTLQALWRAAQKQAVSPKKIEERRKVVTEFSSQLRAKSRHGVDAVPPAITAKWLSACLNKVMGKDSLIVNEYPLVLEELEIREPGRYFSNSPAGGLGWGMGAALGAKLAQPDKTVICALGDGSYMFGNPSAGHFVSEAMKLPVLFVIANNARWGAVHRSTLSVYPKGEASQSKEPPFATLEPSPRFEHIVQASGGYGQSVAEPKDLLPALERALKVVREEKRQALLNVRLEPSYVRAS